MSKSRYTNILALAAAGGLAVAAPSVASAACTGGSVLSGAYGMKIQGATPQGVAKILAGVVNFNGACSFSGNVTYGQSNSVNYFVNVTGTYSQSSDSTIALSFTLPGDTAPETYQVGYSPIFTEAVGAETDSSAVSTIDLKAQGTGISYSNATLKGTWSVSCAGDSGTYSDLNYFTFDGTSNNGAGNLAGVDYYNNYTQFGDVPYTGTYAVTYAGVFGGAVLVNGSQSYSYVGVIDNHANEIQFTYFTNGSGATAVDGCIGKRVM